MFFYDRLYYSTLAGVFVIESIVIIRLEIVDVKAKHIPVFYGVCNRVRVQLLLENIIGGFVLGLLSCRLYISCILLKNRCSRKPEQLSLRKELLDCLMVFSELRAMAFIEYENDPLVLQRQQTFLIVIPVIRVQRDS